MDEASPKAARAVTVRVDVAHGEPLRRIWRYVGYDEANYTDTPNGRALLGKLGRLADAPYGVRTHYLLCSGDGAGRPKWGSSNAYTEDAAGNPVYDWTIVDNIFDAQLAAGCRPFVELGFMPAALSTAPAGTPYDALQEGGWRYPPRDYARWQALVQELAAHCRDRYGLREVSQWRWELWNEPDIFYWAGTVEEYCWLYDHTVAGLHAALPQALVGGPGTTNPSRPAAGEFLRTFLEHCTNGRSAVTGERGTRLDFVSFHTKGGGYRRDSAAAKQTPTIAALVGHVAAGLGVIDRFPALAGREVILTECDPDGMAAFGKHDNANLRFRNTEYYASYVASAVCKLMDVGAGHATRVDGMLTWAFQFEGREYFEGLRTLSTNGVDKPVLNVLRLLARLGGRRLALTSDGARDPQATPMGDDAAPPPDVSGLAATDGVDRVQVLLASHHDDWDVTTASAVRIELTGLPASAYHVRRSHIDARHGNAHTAWQALGEPQQPTADELRQLNAAARLDTLDDGPRPTAAGRLTLDLRLPAHAVCLVELEPAR